MSLELYPPVVWGDNSLTHFWTLQSEMLITLLCRLPFVYCGGSLESYFGTWDETGVEILCYHFQCPLVLKIILLFVILYGADLSNKQRTLTLFYQKISIFFIEKWLAVIYKTQIKYKNLLELSCVVWKFGIPLFKQADNAPLLFLRWEDTWSHSSSYFG